MDKELNNQKVFMAIVILFWLVMAGYYIPVALHASYDTKGNPIYEHDLLLRENLKVSYVSLFGHYMPTEDYTTSTDYVNSEGCLVIRTADPKLSTTIHLDSINARSSELDYNDICYEDQVNKYTTEMMEKIYYNDGSIRFIPEQDLDIHYYVSQENKAVTMLIGGVNDNYSVTFPLTTINSITTKSKVSTDEELSSDDLKLTINYSDGTSVKADRSAVTSKIIDKPKKGKNDLICYYNNTAFTVAVKAYNPTALLERDDLPKVNFGKFGKVQMLYFDTYKLGNSTRLNTFNGEVYFNNHRETYYSQRVLSGSGLAIPGRHVASDGTIRDKDGYICVASTYSFLGKHEVVMTSLGPAKVYDSGCPYGTIDLYVNW